jgi:Flp pilus assembly protein TadG
VESAVVLPVMLLLVLAILVGGIGVFRYQQTVMLACEAARWASVRGTQYQQATGQTAAAQQDILQNAVLPRAVGMDPTALTIQVQWIDQTSGTVVAWDSSNKSPFTTTAANQPVSNHVRVTIIYRWHPGVLLPGTITLTSTAEMPMSF